ncbi:MAG: alpha/beta hydrolase [Acidimicrobiia bacterium]
MKSLIRLLIMGLFGWLASLAATIRRLLLGPTMPTWSWTTEWTVASMRAVIARAAGYSDDPLLLRVGLRATTPVPPSLRRLVNVRRVRIGGVEADRFVPDTTTPSTHTLLYFHGGGYVFGNPGTHRQFIAQLVHATGATAVAPQYRLAPRHRYPAAVDDAETAYRALIDGGVDPQTIVLAGDSAGGGLATALLLRIRTQGLPMPRGAVLLSPYLDLQHTSYTIRTNAATDYLPLQELTVPNDWYADRDQLTLPEVSPVHADLTGLPALLVLAGGAEMILGDSIAIAEHASRDGVDCTLVVEPDMMHVWPIVADRQPQSLEALATIAKWLGGLRS